MGDVHCRKPKVGHLISFRRFGFCRFADELRTQRFSLTRAPMIRTATTHPRRPSVRPSVRAGIRRSSRMRRIRIRTLFSKGLTGSARPSALCRRCSVRCRESGAELQSSSPGVGRADFLFPSCFVVAAGIDGLDRRRSPRLPNLPGPLSPAPPFPRVPPGSLRGRALPAFSFEASRQSRIPSYPRRGRSCS